MPLTENLYISCVFMEALCVRDTGNVQARARCVLQAVTARGSRLRYLKCSQDPGCVLLRPRTFPHICDLRLKYLCSCDGKIRNALPLWQGAPAIPSKLLHYLSHFFPAHQLPVGETGL